MTTADKTEKPAKAEKIHFKLNLESLREIAQTAEDHFSGNLKLAAAAVVFGLGIIKMKKRVPETATLTEQKQIHSIVGQIETQVKK